MCCTKDAYILLLKYQIFNLYVYIMNMCCTKDAYTL